MNYNFKTNELGYKFLLLRENNDSLFCFNNHLSIKTNLKKIKGCESILIE